MAGIVNLLPPIAEAVRAGVWNGMTMRLDPRYAGYRYPAEIIATAVWLYFPFRSACGWLRTCWRRAASR
jgi:hypothetical protein